MKPNDNPMISIEELAEKLGCSADFVRGKVRNGSWPHHRFGPRMIRFSEANVAEIQQAAVRAPAKDSTTEQIATVEKELRMRKLAGATELSVIRKERKLRSLRIQLLMEQQELAQSNE